jgi:N-sulfoglucosamine sulfohydrolase
MSAKRSVLLLIADDWSPLSACYGDKVVQTPHIDALAKQSMVFTRAYCTSPSCAASRANILTGRYSHQHGQYGHCHSIHGFRTHETMRTAPAVLNDAGVRTALIGKDHIAPRTCYPFSLYHVGNPWKTSELCDAARGFLRDVGKGSFFLHGASMFPHRTGESFNRTIGDGLDRDVTYDPARIPVPGFLPDVPEVRQDLCDYYTFVSRYDRFVGAMLGELERSGRADDTLVLVMSDHGMPFPGAKASSFETGHRCPLIVRRPGAAAGRCDALVNWTDIAPTIYDWLGVDAKMYPGDLTGRSLLPLLDAPESPGWDHTFFSHSFHEVTNYFPYRAVVSRRYKYVRNLAWQSPMPLATDLFGSPTWQAVRRRKLDKMGARRTHDVLHHAREALFDLHAEPWETRNLIAAPELQQQAGEMRRMLTELRVKTADPWLEIDYQEGDLSERRGPG